MVWEGTVSPCKFLVFFVALVRMRLSLIYEGSHLASLASLQDQQKQALGLAKTPNDIRL
jgi:hypothetical protein